MKNWPKGKLHLKFLMNELKENHKAFEKQNVVKETDNSSSTNLGWRDDFKFLYELVEAFKQNDLAETYKYTGENSRLSQMLVGTVVQF